MIQHFLSRQFLGFLLTGGVAAAVNFGSRFVYNQWVGFSPAVVLAYLTGMAVAFGLARAFVFRESRQSLDRSAAMFVLVNVFAVLQTWAVSVGLGNHVLPALGIDRFAHEIAHAIGIVVPVFTSYLGHKRWSFA